MGDLSAGLLVVLALVLMAEFVNGWTDAPNAIATVVSTRVLAPGTAVVMATLLNILGTMSGTAVAATIGKGIVQPEAINFMTVGAAMVGLIFWSTLAWRYGLPTSESHALIAGLTGAGLGTAGPGVLLWAGWKKVLIGLVFSTFLGFGGGWLIIVAIFWLFRRTSPGRVRRLFGTLQVLSAAFMAFSHGSNDGQKFIGVFTLALMLGGVLSEFRVSWEIILLCSVIMGIGTSVGGWRIIRTMGMRMVKLEPHQGFAAEAGAAMSIEIASRLGVPVSTTHTISTAIMGVGASRKLSAVRWGVVREVVAAWVLTFPVCGIIAYLIALVLKKVF
ncbi:MAG: phosphate transporter [Candidatus Handelsmanbacteria bacterium RIFCSPLOWO2_12_FULL_64_10]|uniref:Phosphate transporter n=1 Tax=Handelsmanbacteria sp. (strain RIFCSPLOWO2_12_FULL_64_10) TaxID=1817868 RepID=A0A1F6CWA1_HANXR|nr:MAG: phosphate transporter [Candidatus Handelsmanbacteria bacterium RIFCSPLOWO2_12_FULL_64_10]